MNKPLGLTSKLSCRHCRNILPETSSTSFQIHFFTKLRSWTIKTIIPLMRSKGFNRRGDYRGKLIKTGFGCRSHGFGQGEYGVRWLSPRLPRVSNQLVTLCAHRVLTTAWNRNRNYWFQMDQTQLVSIVMNLLHGPPKKRLEERLRIYNSLCFKF